MLVIALIATVLATLLYTAGIKTGRVAYLAYGYICSLITAVALIALF